MSELVECVDVLAEECRTGEKPQNRVNMSISTGGLEFKLDTTVDHSLEARELAAKLELALEMLASTENRLEAALIRIGQLQNQLQRTGEAQSQ